MQCFLFPPPPRFRGLQSWSSRRSRKDKTQKFQATRILQGSKPVPSRTLLSPPAQLCPLPPLRSAWEPGSGTAPSLGGRQEAGGPCFTLSRLSAQTGSGDCTFSKGATSGRWEPMATSQGPTRCRNGGPGCPPTSRRPQCRWRTETSTSSKVPTRGADEKGGPARGQRRGGTSIPTPTWGLGNSPGRFL